MSFTRALFRTLFIGIALVMVVLTPAHAQGRDRGQNKVKKDKETVSIEIALTATREVLTERGFDVVRIEQEDDFQIVYYRRGNRGRGRGGGPVERLVIRWTPERVEVRDAPDEIRIGIEIKLGIRIL